MIRFFPKVAILAGAISIAVTANSRDGEGMAPILGDYPNTLVSLSDDTTVTAESPPTNATAFKGKLEGYPATGMVRVTAFGCKCVTFFMDG